MHTVFALFLLPITVADLNERIIPNIYVKILSFFLGVSFIINGFPSSSLVFIIGILSLVLSVLRVGMGDLKLLAILMLTFQLHPLSYLALVLTAATVHIVISSAKYRAIPRSIPLAPAIFLGFITYMAAR